MPSILILLIPIITASAAQIFLKKGLLVLGKLDFSLASFLALLPKILQNIWLVSGMILFAVSFLFYLFSLSKFQLNIIYPVFVSAGIIIVSLASWFFFKETVSWAHIFGIISIIFGIFILGAKA